MAVIHSPESNYAKEMWRWDNTTDKRHPLDPSIRGLRPVTPQEYPKMLHKAGRSASGPVVITDRVMVHSAQEQRNMESRGFVFGPAEAIAAYHAADAEISQLAAERHFHERRMSEAAQREVAAIEAETDDHLPVIPETPVKRGPGRPRRTVSVA